MGVVHKLNPEVLSFIIENKQNSLGLSCRQLTSLILEKFQIKVSKSSINVIFKEKNLSMPIGRMQKPKKKKLYLPPLPAIEVVKAMVVVKASEKSIQKLAQNIEPEISKEISKEELSAEEKRVKAAEEWAIKLQKDECTRVEEKLSLEKQRLKDGEIKIKAEEIEVRAHLEVVARLKAEDEARKRVLEEASQAAAKNTRKQEEALKLEEEKAALEAARIKALEEEKAAQEAGLSAEQEKWARLAEAEQKSKPLAIREEAALLKVKSTVLDILPEDRVCSGAIMLKALDCLIGGSREINAAISRAIEGRPEDSLSLTQALIFKPLFGKDNFSTLKDLIGVSFSQEKLNSCYVQIRQITDIGLDTAKIILDAFTEAKGVKVHFNDGSVIHLDGQLYSSWPAARFPFDFSNTANELKNNLNKYFFQGKPLVLFSPCGYDILPKDFFSLLLNIGSKDNYPDSLTLFGDQLEELDNLSLNYQSGRCLVFGLWPWQFPSSRKVKKIGDFHLKHIEGIGRDLYLGEVEIDLFRASLNQVISLKGCAIKTDLKEKIRLVVLNSGEQAMSLDELAEIYLSRWPNFEEGAQDFNRKIELFTYANAEPKFFPRDSFGLDTAGLTKELAEIFATYIKMLDAYLRWHFLPAGYTEKDLSSTSECFYKIPVKLEASRNKVKVKAAVSQDYPFLKDLEYLICRLNERQIKADGGKLLWFESAFK